MFDPTDIIPTVDDGGPGNVPDVRPRRLSSVHRRALGGVALIVIILLGLLVGVAASSGDSVESAGSREPFGSHQPAGDDDGDESDLIEDATEDGFDVEDDSYGYPDGGANVEQPPAGNGGGGGGPVELDPVETVDEQCGKVLATGASLLVTPDPAILEPGGLSNALTIHNCGDDDVDWTAHTVPTVALDTAASTLAAGTTTQLGYTIDVDAYEPGAVEFKIKVSEPGYNNYVDVHAFRPLFGQDVAAGNGTLSAGAEHGGCATSCITKAWLTPNASTSNLAFEVQTDTPATIELWVRTQPPTGVGAPNSSLGEVTQWNTLLQPLEAAETYHLLLRATDEHGNVDERRHSFTAPTPVDTADDLAPIDPKCHAQCIAKAALTPGDDFSVQHLDVQSTTPARFQVWVSTEAPTMDGGVPTFDDPDIVEVSGLEYHESWQVDLTPLEGSTTYHIVVRAEDTDGTVAHRVGTFGTAAAPTFDVLVAFQHLTVTHDGDSSWHNRGELSFAWAVGDDTLGSRGEQKMSDGDGFDFSPSNSTYLLTGLTADDFLPNIRVSGSERDADGKVEFCSLGTGAPYEAGHSDKCDAKWNVAASGLVTVGSVESMTRCSEFGIAEPVGSAACMLLTTVDEGDDYARFDVVVSLHVTD